MVLLSVNVDHVATVREARKTNEPDPVAAAFLVEQAGADGITIHLREDRRHIHDRDLSLLMKTTKLDLNLEMAATPEMVDIALRERPSQSTLVPEKRQEITTEGGLDVAGQSKELAAPVQKMQSGGVPVSMFIDPIRDQIQASKDLGAVAVELHTGEYAETQGARQDEQYVRLSEAAAFADSLGLMVRAGHGLTYQNTRRILAIPQIGEVSIGHTIVSRAVLVGMVQAVRDMLSILGR
jgi:pyridoxine 5-phosphate synthase